MSLQPIQPPPNPGQAYQISSQPSTTASATIPPSDKTIVISEKRVWTKEEGEMLLDLYEEYRDRFKNPGVRKNLLWAEICAAINNKLHSGFSPDRCHQKLRNFKNDFQKIIMLEKKDCRHFDRLHRIFLQSSNKPLQNPADLKRKLSQLAGPKTSGKESGTPEKRPKTILPDFRSKKLKAASTPKATNSQKTAMTKQGNYKKPSV